MVDQFITINKYLSIANESSQMYKSLSKPQSMTNQTRVSNSNIFNNSYLMNTSAPQIHPPKCQLNNVMSMKIKQSETRQIQFLREKNFQLNQQIKRMGETIKEKEVSNRELLKMNRKYVSVVNRYYENQNIRQNSFLKKYNSKKQILEANENVDENISGKEAHRLLLELEKNHRNLVKHCLVMEQQIKNYNEQITHYNLMKDQLYSVNHTSVKQLVQQIQQLTQENKELKTENNLIGYELEKSKFQHDKLKNKFGTQSEKAGNTQNQIAKMRSLVNTVQQQSSDKSKVYESRIYELELKVQKLEEQLRESQKSMYKTNDQRKQMVIKHVQQVHDFEKLRKSYMDLQNVINRKKPQRPYSTKHMNHSVANMFQTDVKTINQMNGVGHKNQRVRKARKSVSRIEANI